MEIEELCDDFPWLRKFGDDSWTNFNWAYSFSSHHVMPSVKESKRHHIKNPRRIISNSWCPFLSRSYVRILLRVESNKIRRKKKKMNQFKVFIYKYPEFLLKVILFWLREFPSGFFHVFLWRKANVIQRSYWEYSEHAWTRST